MKAKGSYTVEATFIMCIIISCLFLLFTLGIFLYNSCILKQHAYIAALRGSLLLVENEFVTESEKKYQDQVLLTNRQLKYTLIGLGITAISLGVSIFFNIYQISNKDINKIKITNDKLYIALDEIEKKSSQEQMKIIKQEVSEQMKEFQKEVGKYQKPDSKDKVE